MGVDSKSVFKFKQFNIAQDQCTMKVGTDGVLLGAWADLTNVEKVLDIGAGSGLIAIMLGQRSESAEIHAVEIDKAACEQAKGNMAAVPWNNRLHAFEIPIQDYVKTTTQQYDLIVSNPPFFSGGTFSNNQDRNSVRHTIKLPHGDLLSAVRSLLKPDGKFAIILPLIEGLRFQELAKEYGLYPNKITEVHSRVSKPVERLLVQFGRLEKAVQKGTLNVQQETGELNWTDEYKALTAAFYVDF